MWSKSVRLQTNYAFVKRESSGKRPLGGSFFHNFVVEFRGTQLKGLLVTEDSKDNVDYFVHHSARRGFIGLRLPLALEVFSKHRVCVGSFTSGLDRNIGGHIQNAPQIL